MFNNIGEKIKGLAKFVCWVGIIVSVIAGLVIMSMSGELLLLGIVIGLIGSLLSWLGSFALYGLGQLIHTNELILKQLGGPDFTAVRSQNPLTGFGSASDYGDGVYSAKEIVCEGCGETIKKEICPFCGKANGSAAERIAELGSLLRAGEISLKEYEKRVARIKDE